MKKILAVLTMLFSLALPVMAGAASDIGTPNISVTTSKGSASFTLKSDTAGVKIYYTTDGTDPDNRDKLFSSKVTLKETKEVRAVAYDKTSDDYSDVGYYLVSVTKERAATPTVKGEKVDGGVKVTIKSNTSGASVYYTLDGSVPTSSDKRYSSAITIDEPGTTYVRAVAVKSGMADSATATFVVRVDEIAAPTITISGSGDKTVTIKSVSGATIYYTTNGADPTTKSTKYSKPFKVTKACTIKAIAVKKGAVSTKVAEKDTGDITVGAPTITKENILGGVKLEMKSDTSGAKIYYTLDGSVPTTKSKVYTSSGVSVTEAGDYEVRAISVKSGFTDSPVKTGRFTVPKAATPTIKSSGGKVSFTCSTSKATFYYTTNGSTPTMKSTKYTSAFKPKAGTLKVIAAAVGYAPSDVRSATVTSGKAAAPKATVTAVVGGKTVKLSSSTSGAKIYYTTDGTAPDADSMLYTSSGIKITEAGTVKIRAIAVKSGYSDSDELSYSVTLQRLAVPEVRRNGNTITIETASGSTVYYTTNGDTPTTKSTKYTKPFTITKDITLKLIVVRSGYADSKVGTAEIEYVTEQVSEPYISDIKAYSTYNNVTVKCSTSGARIYYTTNGSTPTKSSKNVASGSKIKITEDCDLRMIAMKSGLENSEEVVFPIIIGDDNISYMSLQNALKEQKKESVIKLIEE